MSQSKADYLEKIEAMEKLVSGGVWTVVEDPGLDVVWVSTDADGVNSIALLDYNSEAQNKADARFIAFARNHTRDIITEIKSLRARVVNLIEENNKQVEERIKLQNELNSLKEK